MTLKRKILTRIYLLTFLIIIAMSVSYYLLFTNDVRKRSHQQVIMTFRLIADDLRSRVDTALPQISQFSDSALLSPMYMLRMLQQQSAASAQNNTVWNLTKKMTYLSGIALEMQEFGSLVDAQEILIYDHDRQLLAVLMEHGGELQTSVYLPELDGDVLAPIHKGDLWYAMLQSLDEIPRRPLPEHVSLQDEGPLSNAAVSTTRLGEHIALTIRSPIFEQGELLGTCVVHLNIRRHDVERYAGLSGTEVNIFAGSRLSVGTLEEHNYFALPKSPAQADSRWLAEAGREPAIEFSRNRARETSYYQGVLLLGTPDAVAGAITVHLPRSQEKQEVSRFLLIVVAMTLGFSILVAFEAIGLSEAIVRPILHLIDVMQVVEAGNYEVKAPDDDHDEIGKLAHTFNTMTAQINAGFAKIERQNKELKELDKLKDEFLSNTSHELRTPLNGIAGLADAMLSGADGPLTTEERKHTQMILQSSKRLSAMVNSILDYSKARSEKLKLKIQRFGIAEVTDLVITMARPQLKDRPVALSMELPAELPKVYGDMDQVEQILTNLVGNAVKFTREGQIVISAGLTPRPPLSCEKRGLEGELAFVKITVSDTGIGIPEQAKPRIFTAFEQADGSSSREFGGTGLGLAITKELVQLHGGTIGVESEEGVGSSFWFTLPCTPEAIPSYKNASKERPLSSRERGPRGEVVGKSKAVSPSPDPSREGQVISFPGSDAPSGIEDEVLPLSSEEKEPEGEWHRKPEADLISSSNKGKRIMIVEDDPINLEVMETHLTHAGFETIRAINGKEAIDMINGDTVDLILCDVMMPLVDGFTFAMRMQEKDQLRRTPLVFVSAKGEKTDIMRGLRAGAVEYITKPVESDELLLKINALLELTHTHSVENALGMVMTQDREYPTGTEHDPQFLTIQRGKGEKILVVDDEEVNVEVFQSQLKHYNYEVIVAENGYEALRKLEAEQPDLVLLDLMMPGLPGHKVCQEMRRTKNYYELPIIILTAKHETQEKIYGLNIGANDYMLKPFHKEELLTRIALLLRLSALQKTVIARNAELEVEIIERRQAEEALRHEVTERIKAQRDLQQLNDKLEARVKERTEELEAAVEHLKSTQVHLVEAEKMAALAGLVTGVAHELNTPIGIGITSSSYLSQELKTFIQQFQSGEMTRSSLEKFLGTVTQSVAMTFANLQRVSNLVKMFKQLDVHRSGEEMRRFPVKSYLENTVRGLQLKLEWLPHQIHISADEELMLESFPGAFSHVISSLLMNALIHAYDEEENGQIRMSVRQEGEELFIELADDGRGISGEHREKIFDPFFTTARGKGGSGLGLHIVYMIVRQKLKGSIRCESELGRGTRFLLRVPLSLVGKI